MTTAVLFTNNAEATLASSVTTSQTTITLTSGQGTKFPNPGANQFFPVTLQSASISTTIEICYCTSRSGDVLTVTRAQEGTTATAFNAGDLAQNRVTKGTLALFGQLQADQTWSGINTFSASPVVPNATQSDQAVAFGQLTNNFSNLAVFTVSGATVNGSSISWTNGGNWPVPANITRLKITVAGGGGGSVGGTGASGAAGGVSFGFFTVTPAQNLAVTVGAAGLGSATIGFATNGGTSSITGLLSATGGTAGASGSGPGGVGSGGFLNIQGQAGTDLDNTNTWAPGGSTPFGLGMGGIYNAGGASQPATGYGGGGGAGSGSGAQNQNGTAGVVIIEY